MSKKNRRRFTNIKKYLNEIDCKLKREFHRNPRNNHNWNKNR